MNKKLLSAVSIFILSIILFFTTQVNAAQTETKRLWGSNRYQTCSQIVNQGWNTSDYAILVNGENFPDALSASVLAKKYNAPILLTGSSSLDDTASNQLTRLKVKKVFIVGGNAVISSTIQDSLDKMGISVERIYGDNRYATSIAVANQIGTDNGIILTTGSDYTDALSVAPIAAKLQIPIILMPKESIPDAVSSFVSGKNIPRTYILGDSDIISDAVVTKFPNIERIPGKDKFERNINIINEFADKFDFSKACLAYSEGFADALSGSAYAAINGNPIILVGDTPSENVRDLITNKNSGEIDVIGGTAGITEATVSSLLGTASISPTTGTLKVHYIDVGQGDSILIQTPNGKNMLIDAGTNESSNTVTSYLSNLGITQLDIIAGTHPHEDHIGGMDAVINMFKIGKVYMPKATATTKTFEDVITAINNKGLSITTPVPGTTVDLDSSVKLEILAPNEDAYEELNNYSIVFKLTYGSKSFLFTGDAEDVSEKEMLSKGYDLKADVLKVGHHGSSSSTSDAFLSAVNPQYAVISVGKDNDYGHPAVSTMDKLKAKGIAVYRTDENGTIVATCDGTSITFNTNPGTYSGRSSSGNNETNDNISTAPSTPLDTNVSAGVDNINPSKNTTVNLAVTGPIGASVKAVCHYKSTDTPYTGTIGSDGKVIIPIKIGTASSGYKVNIDITVVSNGTTLILQSSFTPQ